MTKKFILYSSPLFLIFSAFSLFEPWFYINVFASTSTSRLEGKKFEIVAHKGASGMAPENTLAAFQKALDLEVDQIEMDVRLTKDNKIVVFHDATLERTMRDSLDNPIKGNLHDYTLAELKQYNVGMWFDPKDSVLANQKIPTLKEALDLIDGKCKVLVEIKHMDHPNYHNFAEKLVDLIHREDGVDWIILQSYERDYLEEVHEADSLVKTKAILVGEDSTPFLAFYIETRMHMGGRAKEGDRLTALNPEWTTLSPRRVFRMHARGYKVYAYPVNERENMIKMLNAGVDGIITDYPNRAIELRRELNK